MPSEIIRNAIRRGMERERCGCIEIERQIGRWEISKAWYVISLVPSFLLLSSSYTILHLELAPQAAVSSAIARNEANNPVMRAEGVLRLMLNVSLYVGMTLIEDGKHVRSTVFEDGERRLVTFRVCPLFMSPSHLHLFSSSSPSSPSYLFSRWTSPARYTSVMRSSPLLRRGIAVLPPLALTSSSDPKKQHRN